LKLKKEQLSTACRSRREFLLAGGSVVLLPNAICGSSAMAMGDASDKGETSTEGEASAIASVQKKYPRKEIARLVDIEQDKPLLFRYPNDDETLCSSFLVKLGESAGSGIGPAKDIVAFNSFCPHMGGPLAGVYNKEYKVAGPCPLHLSTFDLTRHGMLVSGHATEGLPQVLLELEGGVIYGVGMQGLVYGFSDNLQALGR